MAFGILRFMVRALEPKYKEWVWDCNTNRKSNHPCQSLIDSLARA